MFENKLFTVNDSKTSFLGTVSSENRGSAVSVFDMYGSKAAKLRVGDAKIHDANFAFLTTALAKLHKELYEPKYYVTWNQDVPFDAGGGFVDYVEYYSVEWAGIVNSARNLVGNDVNYIPRVNAAMNQNRANVFTYETAYDLRFIDLEKMKKLTLQKSIQEIYKNIITAGWDLFVQDVAYVGVGKAKGLFNNDNVLVTTITNTGTTGKGFAGLSDAYPVSFINGLFELYLQNSNMNISILPDTILVPTFVMADLVGRYSPLYANSLYDFILNHNLAIAQSGKEVKLTIAGRSALNNLGTGSHGRIVAYKKDKDFVRIDLPYPMQHYMTLPNIEKASYTSIFVGQVSEIQLPYNTSSAELGIVTYWDFTAEA